MYICEKSEQSVVAEIATTKKNVSKMQHTLTRTPIGSLYLTLIPIKSILSA